MGNSIFIRLAVVLWVFVQLAFFTAAQAESPNLSKVHFGEIMGAGSSSSSYDKWIELYNNSDEIVDLSGWSIVNTEKEPDKGTVLIDDGQIPPRGYFLIAHNARDKIYAGGESVLNIVPDVVDTKVSWDKSKFNLFLFDDNGIEADRVGDSKKLFYSETDGRIASMQRIDFAVSGDDKTAWAASTKQEHVDINVHDYATPQNSGRPKIKSISLSPDAFPQGGNISFEANYSVDDSHDDLDKIVVEAVARNGRVIQKIEKAFGKKQFEFKAQSFEKIKFTFFDKTGLWQSQDFNIIFYQLSNQIKISELFPHPLGADQKSDNDGEWIELVNLSASPVNLSGWKLKDSTKRGVFYLNNMTIPPHGYLIIRKQTSKIIQNDSQDHIYLFDPIGAVADEIEYSDSSGKHINQSFARDGKSWIWTTIPTPGKTNVIKAPAEIAPSQEKNPPSLNQKSKSSSSSRDLTTSAATEENETKIILTTVTTTTKITPAFDDLAKAEFAPIVLGASAKNSSRGFIKLNFLLYFYAVVGFLTIVLVYDIYRPKRE